MTDYDKGFRDGIAFVSRHLRIAAERAERVRRGTVEKDGKTYDVVLDNGQPRMARRLRELADELQKMSP